MCLHGVNDVVAFTLHRTYTRTDKYTHTRTHTCTLEFMNFLIVLLFFEAPTYSARCSERKAQKTTMICVKRFAIRKSYHIVMVAVVVAVVVVVAI